MIKVCECAVINDDCIFSLKCTVLCDMMLCKEIAETLYLCTFSDEKRGVGEVPTVLAPGRAPSFDACVKTTREFYTPPKAEYKKVDLGDVVK